MMSLLEEDTKMEMTILLNEMDIIQLNYSHQYILL